MRTRPFVLTAIATPMLAGMLLAACGEAGTPTRAGAGEPTNISGGLANGSTVGAPVPATSGNSQSSSTSNNNLVLQAQGDRQVIQDATLGLRIKSGSFWDVYNRAVAIAASYNGYLVSSSAGDPTDSKVQSGVVVVAVPAQSYSQALQSLRDLGTPNQLQVTTQDVSEQYVDLHARLVNAQAQQAVLLGLMKKSQSIQDSITVEEQLTNVTGQIEQIEGQLRYLDQRTAYSTITLNLFVVAPAPQKPSVWKTSGLASSLANAGQGFAQVLGAMVVALGYIAPFALLALAGLGIWRLRSSSLRPTLPQPGPPSK